MRREMVHSAFVLGLLIGSVFGCGPKEVVWAPDPEDPINKPVKFPDRTADGQRLRTDRPMTIVVLPACDSCRVKQMPSDWKKRLPNADLVVVLSPREPARKQYPAIAGTKTPVIFSPESDELSEVLDRFAPGIVRYDPAKPGVQEVKR